MIYISIYINIYDIVNNEQYYFEFKFLIKSMSKPSCLLDISINLLIIDTLLKILIY